MSSQNLKNMQSTSSSDVISIDGLNPTLIMPQQILEKIQYLCQKISIEEWSGVMFYSVQGTIADPANMVCTIEDIFPMHKGNKTYTEYSFDDPALMDYMMENPEIMQWRIAHIHSHNSMGVFFSGTDVSELVDNSKNHIYYLSLIVNNAMDFTAKIAFRGDVSVENLDVNYQARDENDEYYDVLGENVSFKRSKVFTLDCKIVSPEVTPLPVDPFKYRVDQIINEAAQRQARVQSSRSGQSSVQNGQGNRQVTTYQGGQSGWNTNHNYQGSKGVSGPFSQAIRETNSGWGGNGWQDPDDAPITEASYSESDSLDTEDFVAFCLRLGNPPNNPSASEVLSPQQNLNEAIEDIERSNTSPKFLAETIVENFMNYYETFYDPKGDYTDFPENLAEVQAILDAESETSPFLKPVHRAMEKFAADFYTNSPVS